MINQLKLKTLKKLKVYFKNGETYNERIKTYTGFRKLHS